MKFVRKWIWKIKNFVLAFFQFLVLKDKEFEKTVYDFDIGRAWRIAKSCSLTPREFERKHLRPMQNTQCKICGSKN